jgi:ATP-dependent helicase YprA (DUF1998 family)
MQPLALAQNVCAEYRRYIETTFPILDEALRQQINEKINNESLLWKGPYVSLSQPFARGITVADLAREELLSPQAARIFAGWTLYDHQEQATRRLADGQHTIVASSTGSGKTEAFLIPIIDYCLRHKRETGIKAVLMYPMNALANDQLKRLRRLLKGTGITFAKYTGDTAQHVQKNERPADAPAEEALDRATIQDNPPDILLTNYAMLELLLVRREDQQIFRHKQVRYLVLDEVHTYGGARGIEVACLIRRFKEHIESSNGGLVCVGTSATVKGDDIGEVASFASKLFAEPFDQDAIILERFDPPAPLNHPYWPASPQLDEQELTEFDPAATEKIVSLAERLCGQAVPAGDTIAEQLWHLLVDNALLRLLEKHLTIPRALDELVAYLQQQPERRTVNERALVSEIIAYLLVGSLALGPQGPRLRPKVHMLYRGLEGFTRCLNCYRVWEAGIDLCPACNGRCLPLEVCRSCGQDFWRGITNIELSPADDPLAKEYRPPKGDRPRAYEINPDESRDSTPGRTVHLTLNIQRVASFNEDEEAEEAQDNDSQGDHEGRPYDDTASSSIVGASPRGRPGDSGPSLKEIYVCGNCGYATLELPASGCCVHCEGQVIRMRYHAGRISQCPACQGRYGSREIVTTFGTSVAASIAVLTSAIMKRLDEAERRLLIFSDSRQDTAFQAGYLADKHGQFTKRQLIYQVVDEEARQGNPAVGLADLPRLLYNYGMRLGLFEYERRERERENNIREETWPILAEFARGGNRRLSLEGLGLIRVNYYRLRESLADNEDALAFADDYHLSLDELYSLSSTILDEMRTRRALDHPLLISPIQFREEKVEGFDRDLRPIGYGEQAIPKGHAYKILPLANKRGSPAQLQVYLRKVLRLSDNASAVGPVRKFVHILEDLRYLQRSTIGKAGDNREALMVDHQRIELAPVRPGEGYECNACRRVYSHNVRNICPAMHCAGSLRPLRPKQENYYVHSYLEHQLVRLVPQEHSGQIDGKTREKYEEDFREGAINILVCTPTMELGVDIGDLPSVMMRNVPPSPANYAQRSGRAGRAERIALIGTFAQNRGHDSYYYDRPADMIRGVVRAPVFGFDNQRIIQRHLHALILEKLDAQFPNVLGKMVDDDDRLVGIRPLIDELKKRHSVIQSAIAAAFARDTHAGGLPWLTSDYVGSVIDAFPIALERAFRPWLIERRGIIEAIDEIPPRRPTPEQKKRLAVLQTLLYKMEEDPMRAYTLSYLARQGFLPAYVFVGDQMRMIAPGEARDPLLRGQDRGITEFAPGNLVYCDGNIYSITGLDFQRSDAPERDTQYRVCPDGHWITLVPTAQHCEECEKELQAFSYIGVRSFLGSLTRTISAAEETRASEGYDVHEYLLTEGDTGEQRFGPAGFDLTYHRNTTIFVTNTGFNHGNEKAPQGFRICTTCGQWHDPHQSEWEQRHRRRCAGIVRSFHLAYKMETDVLEIDIPGAAFPTSQAEAWEILPDTLEAAVKYPITLRNALVLGANLALQTEADEIAGFEREVLRDGYRQRQIILYDDVPGGAGYVERLSRFLPAAAAAALERLEQCACVDSCYRCLRSYYNQWEHKLLDKRLVIDTLYQIAEIEKAQ